MLWFKRWYHERFVNHTRDTGKAVLSADVKKKLKRKVIRIIYDGCNDDSITCRHRNSYWFIRRRRPIDSTIVTSIRNISRHNSDENAIELNTTATATTTSISQSTKAIHNLQVDDKNVIINNDTQQSTDIDSSSRFSCGSSELFFQNCDSFVTNVNQYGNGENDCGSLSKSKDPRLRTFKLSIVPEICCNICNPSAASFDVKHCLNNDSSRIQIQYDSDGTAETDEWPPKPFQQIEFLQQRIKELEYFIAEIETRVRSNTTTTSTTIPDSNQNSRKCQACDEQPLTDWVIVSIESKPITTCESFSDDDRFSSITPQSSSSFVQYYTTSEFSDRKTIVTVHQCPSNYSLNSQGLYERTSQSSSLQEYGINETDTCAIERLLCFVRFLDLNIQTGTPSLFDAIAVEAIDTIPSSSSASSESNSTMKFSSISTSQRCDGHSSDSIFLKDPMFPEFNYLLQEPCSSSKHSNVLTAQMFHNSLSSISTIDSLKSPYIASLNYCSTESIPEYFGLNECGDIIIHIDHICEEKGFGFLLGRKKKIYCDVPYGEEVYEKPKFTLKFAVKRFFQAMSNTIGKCTTVVGELNHLFLSCVLSSCCNSIVKWCLSSSTSSMS